MTVATLRPDASADLHIPTAGNDFTIGGGAGSLHAATSDNSDTTYIKPGPDCASGCSACTIDFGTTSLPAGAIVKSLAIRIRQSTPTGSPQNSAGALRVDGVATAATSGPAFQSSGGTATRAAWSRTLKDNGQALTQASVDSAQLYLTGVGGQGSTTINTYEIYLDATYVALPVCTVNAPSGTITTTRSPAVTWGTTLDSDGGTQTTYEVKVFADDVYGAGGFDPATSSPYTTSGQVSSAAGTWAMPVALPSDTYRAYVRVAQTVNGSLHWSAWAYSGFVINITPGGGYISQTGLSTSAWTPILSTDRVGVGPLTHRGGYRVYARIWSELAAAAQAPKVRFVWAVGDIATPVENAAIQLPAVIGYVMVDLGEIRLHPSPIGAHHWQGVLQGMGVGSNKTVFADKLFFVPIDEGSGLIRAPFAFVQGLAAPTEHDEFDQATGALNAKTLPTGQAWATSGATTDLAIVAGAIVQRSTTSDSGYRIALAGSTAYALTAVGIDFQQTGTACISGLLARWVNSSNYLRATFGQNALRITKVVAGSVTELAMKPLTTVPLSTWYSLRMVVDVVGNVIVWLFPKGSPSGDPVLTAYDATLATGGALDDGICGFLDTNPSITTADVRSYDNFVRFLPNVDAIMYPNQSVELRHDGIDRENAAGTSAAPASQVLGDLPRLPVSGLEQRGVELLVKPSRGDLLTVPDSGAADGVTVQAYYRPTWLFVPEDPWGS